MPFRYWELESEANPMDVFAVTICSLTVLQSFFFLSFYFFVALVSYYLMYTGKGVCEPETRRDGRTQFAGLFLFVF